MQILISFTPLDLQYFRMRVQYFEKVIGTVPLMDTVYQIFDKTVVITVNTRGRSRTSGKGVHIHVYKGVGGSLC